MYFDKIIKQRYVILIGLIIPGIIFFAGSISAWAWHASIYESDYNPARAIAVDKNKQQLYVLGARQDLKRSLVFACTTGQNDGDKQIAGDMKTPEGVYFVNDSLRIETDFPKYGGMAFPLNYPNPIDRLRQKNGSGIWIHGRGKELVPNDTLGCVALPEIVRLSEHLPYGTPVIIAETIDLPQNTNKTYQKKIAEVVVATKEWNRSWENRSEQFFNFYDQRKYSLSTEDFNAFAANKRRLFAKLPWIKIETGNIRIVDGPGYWVSYFSQSYKSPTIVSKGIRRLYWEQDDQKQFKIIAMEWVRETHEKEDIYLAGLTDATLLTSAPDSVSAPPADSPKVDEHKAASGVVVKTDLPGENKKPLEAKKTQFTVEMDKTLPTVIRLAAAVKVIKPPVDDQPTGSSLLAEAKTAKTPAQKTPVEKEYVDKLDKAPPKTQSADPSKELVALVEAWRKSWLKADLKTYMSFYAPEARQGDRAGSAAIEEQKKKLWKISPPQKINITNVKCKIDGKVTTITFMQIYSGKNGLNTKGRKTLILKQKENRWLIVKETWG